MLLETERLHIRYITENDWKSVKKIRDDFNLSEYAKYDKPFNTEEADIRARLSMWEKANSSMEHMFFAVCLHNIMSASEKNTLCVFGEWRMSIMSEVHDVVIGYIAFNQRNDGYEMGYCFHSDYHGKGYAKESHLALIEYLKGLGITRFTAGTALKNLPSVKLLKSLGFRQIGEEKISFYKDNNGKNIVFDGGIFELISNE